MSKTIIEQRQQSLAKYKQAAEELFGGPGSGRHPSGSEPRLSSPEGKMPKDVSDDIAKIARVPKEERTEAMVTTMLKNMPLKTLKTLTVRNESWLKQNTHIKDTPKYKAIQREAIVGRRILTDNK